MKIKYLKAKNWLLLSVGGLLSLNLASCSQTHEEEDEPCAYGCPEGIYHVTGTVTDPEGIPIEGIGVGEMDTTDADGRYEVNVWGIPNCESDVPFTDIDGEQNGLYRDTVVQVSAPRSDFHGAQGEWNHGTADVTKDVIMQPVE